MKNARAMRDSLEQLVRLPAAGREFGDKIEMLRTTNSALKTNEEFNGKSS